MADRDNGRIQCFMVETGEFVKEIKKDEFGGEVFAIAYSPLQGLNEMMWSDIRLMLIQHRIAMHKNSCFFWK